MTAATETRRRIRPGVYLIFFVLFAAVVFASHSPFFKLPYFWDEHGQFVPAALDILREGAWVPHSTVPNVHPPGVMAYLAVVWRLFGYSIPATRVAMLALASVGMLFTFLLGIELCRGATGAPAFIAVLLLAADPLLYTQAMMAQLDMPAMVFTVAALLFYLQKRYTLAAAACVALVLSKETGVILPLLFAADRLANSGTGVEFPHREATNNNPSVTAEFRCLSPNWPRRLATAALFVPAFVALGAWLLYLRHVTGHIFGDPGFTHYNIGYALHPVRASLALLRRLYFLFFSDFRWIGALAIVFALRGIGDTPTNFRIGSTCGKVECPPIHLSPFRTPAWRLVALFAGAHVLLVSLLGGAALERYLVPVLPLLYCAVAAALTTVGRTWRAVAVAGMMAGLVAGMFVNPPFPFPYENNLAMADFVDLQVEAAHFVEGHYPGATVYTAWPLTAALRRPEFGYVERPVRAVETSDLHESTLRALAPAHPDVLILYSRTWEPQWGVLRFPVVEAFLRRYYEFEPEMTPAEVKSVLGLDPVMRWSSRGQWVEVFART
ncbi:MAG: hypothetical protein ABSH47_01160 [Bryobacteraceae bacterium]|jgi:hypothetical protein